MQSPLSRYRDTFKNWEWIYIYYPLEITLEKKSLSGEKKPFKELCALVCNKVSSGPLLPRVGDLVEVPGLGNPGGHNTVYVKQVEFGRPLEEISKRQVYKVFLDVSSDDDERWSRVISEGSYYGWKVIRISDEAPHSSYWISCLPGAKFFKPDYLDSKVKESEFNSLLSMSTYDINSNRKKLSYLRHHYPEVEKYF